MLEGIFSNKTLAELEMLRTTPHPVIFTGKIGAKGLEAALDLSRAWLGTDDLETHPDFRIIDSEKNILTKEDVASICEDCDTAPALCTFRVYVIKDAWRLNPYAQNSLLKAIEDNEAECKVIFIGGDSLLATVKSRCRIVNFCSLPYSRFLGGGADYLAYAATRGVYDEYMELMADEETYRMLRSIPECFVQKTDPLRLFGLAREKDENSFFDNAGHKEKVWLINVLKTGFAKVITSEKMAVEPEFSGYFAISSERAWELLDEVLDFEKDLDGKTTADFFTLAIKLGKEEA